MEENISTANEVQEESCHICHNVGLKLLQQPQCDKETKIYSIKQDKDSICHIGNDDGPENHIISNFEDTNSVTETIIIDGQPLCRICLEHGNEPLVNPCKCDGSARYVHESCLLKWFHKTRRKRCEICLSKVNIKSTGCKPIRKWRIPRGTYNFVFYFYIIYALATFCTSSIAFSVAITERCITPTCIALYIACILSILSLIYCAGFTIYIKLFWKAAVTTNKNWRVYDRVSYQMNERQVTSSEEQDRSSPEEIRMLRTTDQSGEMSSSQDSSINNNQTEVKLEQIESEL